MKPLRDTLAYSPVELSFGTSGLRGLVRDITNLEAFIGVRAFFSHLLENGGARAGQTVYLAGDLRPSTDSLVASEGGRGEILQAAALAVEASGLTAAYLGKIPSPALMLYAVRRGSPSVMVTGSHIPFDRNGIKLNKPSGEVMKADEAPILEAMKRVRAQEYGRPADESPFDSGGMVKRDRRKPLPAPVAEAAEEYIQRYVRAFPPGLLSGARILVWQHSAVGRDILTRIVSALGAQAVPAGRSDEFTAVDTEAVNGEMLSRIQALADANGASTLDAVVSTDGDSDRPLVLGVRGGRVEFYPGDLLGLVTAEYLGARHAAVPISANDAIDLRFREMGAELVKTKIGSPHVIAAMKETGWEANGGFLTAARMRVPGGGTLDPLPTRDAALPILAALGASLGRKTALSGLFGSLPARFGKSALVRDYPREKAMGIVRLLSPADAGVEEAAFSRGEITVRVRGGPGQARAGEETAMGRELALIRGRISRHFTPEDGFGKVVLVNWLDGVRIRFSNGDIAHIRPSGNAPELRLYAAADTRERAEEIAARGTAAGGILQRLEREAVEAAAMDAWRAHPGPVRLSGAVRHYDWGGFSFIPGLINAPNPDRRPFAELWIGAHPRLPSTVELSMEGGMRAAVPLDRLVEAAGEAVLGKTADARFHGALPFLLKVLDARTMLSIQVHPSRAQAEAGFRRENDAGIPLSDPRRTYPDANHKPEVHVALTDFWMLHGFRPLEETANLMKEGGAEQTGIHAPELSRIMPGFTGRLGTAKGAAERSALLRDLYGSAMGMPQAEADGILDPLIRRLEKEKPSDKDSPDYWALAAARHFPGRRDRGIFSLYLLNLLHLKPGRGTFQAAGTLHAYLEGANVELMADSDNVLRGGLTSKPVNVPELLAAVSYTDGKPDILEGTAVSAAVREYRTPAGEFLLSRISLEPAAPVQVPPAPAVTCMIVIEGSAELAWDCGKIRLERGRAAMVPAGTAYRLLARSAGTAVFSAGVPEGGYS